MGKRIYTETVKKWAKGTGITGVTLIGLIFSYLFAIGAISNVSYSGDVVCAGTELDPCYAFINFTANEDIFIYPTDYDPWGRNTLFNFNPGVKSWKLERSWGKGWREIPLNETCKGTWCGGKFGATNNAYSYAFRDGKDYKIRITGYKNNPGDTIKWGAFSGVDEIDPAWIGNPTDMINKRTYTSKTFDLGNGTYNSIFNTGDIHYLNNGSLEDINMSLEDMGNYWSLTKSPYKFYLNKTFNNNKLIRFDNKYKGAGHTIYYTPYSVWWINKNNYSDRQLISSAKTVIGVYNQSSSSVLYTDAFGSGIHFEITLMKYGFRKEIIFQDKTVAGSPPSANHIPVAVFKYSGSGLSLRGNNKTSNWNKNNLYEDEKGFTLSEIGGKKSLINPAYVMDSNDSIQRIKVFWELRNGNLFQVKVLPRSFMNNAVYPVRADTETVVFSETGDGTVIGPGGADFFVARDATTGSSATTTDARMGMEGGFAINHNYFPFNTSAITSGATIDTAELSLYIWNQFSGSGVDMNYTVIETNQPNSTTLTTADFNNILYVKGSDTLTYATIGSGAYAKWTLDSTGRGWVKTNGDSSTCGASTGITCLGVTFEEDILNISRASGDTKRKKMRTVEEAGTANDPFLNVTWTTVGDTTAPTYSNNQSNTTIAGTSVNFSILWNDETALSPNGQYVFSTNNTGVWVNDSVINFTATPQWANVVKTLNSTSGISIGYRWYANDSAGNNNNTEVFSLTTTADTCTYTSGNWDVTCSDNCSITSNVNLGGNNLTLSNNTGVFNIQANISNFNKIFKYNLCQINVFSSGGLNK